jgi:ankyrin repeat protein
VPLHENREMHHGHSHGQGTDHVLPIGLPARDIWTASRRGDIELLRLLIEEEGNDVNLGDDDGSTPLHWAAYFDRVDTILYLLQRGADIDRPNTKEGQTPLHWACISKSVRSAMVLIKEGADPSKSDKRGYNSIIHACQYGDVLLVHYLVAKQGQSVGFRDAEGHTPLHWAAYQDHEGVARLLLSFGADIRSTDAEGLTPIHWAALKGHYGMVQLLIINGADVHAVDSDGFTPLDLAKQKSMKGIISLLERSKSHTPGSEALYWRVWFFSPWIIVPLILFIIDSLPFVVAFFVIIAIVTCFRKLLSYTWLSKDTNNPFFMSLMAASYALSTWIYFVEILPLTIGYTMLTLFFIGVNVLWALLFLYMSRSNPGYLKSDDEGIEKIYHRLSSGTKDAPQLCPTCMIARPIRSKHCRSCNRCIARMDHHCAWLNNCVGINNHQFFLVLLTLVIMLHVIFAFFCSRVLGQLQDAPPLWSVYNAVTFYYSREGMILCLMLFHLLNAAWEMYVYYQQWAMLLDNITANEFINMRKYGYLRGPDQQSFHNPFDKGWKANLKEFFYPSYDYFDLFELPSSTGDGAA